MVPYASCSLEDMREVLGRRDKEILELKAEVKAVKKSRTHFTNRCRKLELVAQDAKASETAMVVHSTFRPGKNVTALGGYSLALHRNRGHLGAGTLASIMGGADHAGKLTEQSNTSLSHSSTGLRLPKYFGHESSTKVSKSCLRSPIIILPAGGSWRFTSSKEMEQSKT